jgi:hypothetical protein
MKRLIVKGIGASRIGITDIIISHVDVTKMRGVA